MPTEVRLPQWGEMSEATVVRWFKEEGDAVEKGELLLEVETAKVTTEIEAMDSGILVRIFVPEGEKAEVGTLLALIAAPDEVIAEHSQAAAEIETREQEEEKPPLPKSSEVESTRRLQIEPRARRLAQELSVDLETVVGTGPNGRITTEDVKRAKSLPQKNTEDQWIPLSGRRQVIAERMLQASRETAQLTLFAEADVTVLALLQEKLRNRGIRPLHVAIKATAEALKEHPNMNAHIKGNKMRIFPAVHIGVAVDAEEGLIVPVLKDAETKSVSVIAKEVSMLAEKARNGTLDVMDASGGTFTVTNLGGLGIHAFTPIINQPEVGILGIGRMRETPTLSRGMVLNHYTMWLSLTFDHRAVDGAPAARFLNAVAGRLEDLSWLIP